MQGKPDHYGHKKGNVYKLGNDFFFKEFLKLLRFLEINRKFKNLTIEQKNNYKMMIY